MSRSTVYQQCILAAIPRLLSEQDRDETSPTYGCFDREYWAWATKDFSNIDAQRGVYPLAIVWSHPFANNTYHHHTLVLEWIRAGLLYWCKVQHADGSFDHLYPNEHSFVGVAFTLYDICEAFLLVKDALSARDREIMLEHLRRAGHFLLTHDETHGFLSNHRAGAACALFALNTIEHNQAYLRRAHNFIASIAKNQSREGWFLEYVGADPGYQTLLTHYLANCYRLTKDARIWNLLDTSLHYLKYFIHPNGTIGGDYGLRNTELYYPSGFLLLPHHPVAAAIATLMTTSIEHNQVSHAVQLDARNFITYASAYAQAATLTFPKAGKAALPCQRTETKYFPDSGMFIKSTPSYYLIVSVFKGIIAYFDKKTGKQWRSSGYYAPGKYLLHTQVFDPGRHVSRTENTLTIECPFYRVPERIMTPRNFLLMRVFNQTIGRMRIINTVLRQQFVKTFILHRNKTNKKATRTITFTEDTVVVRDELPPGTFRHARRSSTIFMASARYFHNRELDEETITPRIHGTTREYRL